METSTVVTRPAKLEDKGLILNSWLINNYYSNPNFNKMDKDSYMDLYSDHIKGLFANPRIQIEIAALSDDPDQIVGYIVFLGATLFWAYVKKDYRGKKIFNLLFNGKCLDAIIKTTSWSITISKSKNLKLVKSNKGES